MTSKHYVCLDQWCHCKNWITRDLGNIHNYCLSHYTRNGQTLNENCHKQASVNALWWWVSLFCFDPILIQTVVHIKDPSGAVTESQALPPWWLLLCDPLRPNNYKRNMSFDWLISCTQVTCKASFDWSIGYSGWSQRHAYQNPIYAKPLIVG